MEAMPGVLGVQLFGERAHVRFDPAIIRDADALSSMLGAGGLQGASVRPVPASLEDVFIARLDEARS